MDANCVKTHPNIKILSLNVRGLNRESKRKSIFQYIRKKDIDICFIQETYSIPGVESLWQNQWGGEVVFCHGTNHSKGVMVLIKPNLDITVSEVWVDEHGRFILLNVNLQGCNMQLLDIYAPNTDH